MLQKHLIRFLTILREHPFRFPLLSLVLGAGVITMLGLGKTEPTGFIVSVDVQAAQNSAAEVFWNDFREPPVRANVTGGVRQTLEFRLPPVSLRQLRLDPTELAGETVIIYGVSIRRSYDGTVVNIPLETFARWRTVNVAEVKLNPDSVVVRTATNDPYLMGQVELTTPWRDVVDAKLYYYLHSQIALANLVLIAAICASLLYFGLSRFLPIAATYLLGLFLFLYFLDAIFAAIGISTRYDVASAVGYGALVGVSIDAARWGSLLAGGLTIALAMACGLLLKVPDAPQSITPSRYPISTAGTYAAALFGFGAVFFVISPDLHDLAQRTATQTFLPQWDAINAAAWMGWIARGERPIFDFFYPYSGLWTFWQPLPYGAIAKWIYLGLLYGVTAAGIWRLVRHQLGWLGIALAGLVVLLAQAGLLDQPERYLLSTAVAVTYNAIDRGHPLGRSGRIWFWLAFALAAWGEPFQILYAGPALLVAWISAERHLGLNDPWSIAKRAVLDAAAPALTLLGLVAFYAWRNELGSLIENYVQAAGHWTYAVFPISLRVQLGFFTNIVSPALFGSYFLVFFGTICLWRGDRVETAKLASAILGCGLIGLILFQKHWIRPIGGQTLEPVMVGALLVIAVCWPSFRSRVAVAFFAGALVVTLAIDNILVSVLWDGIRSAYSRILSTTHVLMRDRQSLAAANREAFTRARFANFPEELAAADRLKALGKRSIFVVGDMPIFYLFLNSPIPFQSNQFSASPLRAQLELQKWLEERSPEAAVVDLNTLTLDSVQYVVRLPVVAIRAMLDFVPREKLGHYWLLDRRAAGQPVALEFWREVFGPVVNYGYIVSYSRAMRLPACVSGAPGCSQYLRITFRSDTPAPEQVKVPIEVGTLNFEIAFVRVPHQLEYLLPLDRVWFWALAEAARINPAIQRITNGNYETELVGRYSARPVLY